MENDLISVIIPVFNVEQYLKECLLSVIHQTYDNLEIIIVNDGSTDNSLQVCKGFLTDKRVKLINKFNEGLSSTRNAGIKAAHGIYVCTIDSDDFIEETYIEKMYQKIKKYNADISVCALQSFGTEGIISYYLDISSIDEVNIFIKKDLEQSFYRYVQIYKLSDSWNKMYRKDFLDSSGVKFTLEKQYNGTDLLFNHLLVLHQPKVVCVNEILYHYRILPNSRVRRKNKPLQEGFVVIVEKLCEEAARLGYGKAIYDQISKIYIDMMKYVLQDTWSELCGGGERGGKLNNIVILNKQLPSEIRLLQKMPRISMQFFSIALAMKSKHILYAYAKLLYYFKKILKRLTESIGKLG